MITTWQKIFWNTVKPFLKLHYRRKYGYRMEKFKFEKNQNYLILFNHTLANDPMLGALAFNKTITFLITDDAINRGWTSAVAKWCVSFIPKRKSAQDINAVKKMLKAAKDGDSIMMSPEGNRTYSGELCSINPAIIKLIKKMKLPILLFANEGGYGVEPRWGTKKRKGKLLGRVREVIPYEEVAKMTDDELYKRIVDGLQIQHDGSLYKSKKRAEGIERVLYVCPKCGAIESFSSKGIFFECKKCGLKCEYTEDLHIKGDVEFDTVYKWYMWQLEWLKKYDFNHENIIYQDNGLDLYCADAGKKKRMLSKNCKMTMYADRITFTYKKRKHTVEKEFNINDIDDVTVLMKKKITLNVGSYAYSVKGEYPFNSIKYMFMFYHIRNVLRGDKDEFFGI